MVELDDHHDSDLINVGLATDAGYVGTFRHEADHDLEDLVFAVSDMVVEVLELPTGRIFAFNGTTEWALDSLEVADALWLPREDQLRTLLGPTFVSLERVDSPTGGYAVTVRSGAELVRHVDLSVEAAYARAVLAT